MEVILAVLQQLMRHSSITTTMNFYVGRNAEKASVLWNARKGGNSGGSKPTLTTEEESKLL